MSKLAAAGGAVGVALVLVAGSVAPASAEYYYTQSGAKSVTKDAVHKRYSYSRYETGVFCRPQGEASADSRYKYHRWVCTWAVPSKGRCDGGEDTIFGELLIIGRSGAGAYAYKVTKGAYCEDA